jgi:hypothetical protein
MSYLDLCRNHGTYFAKSMGPAAPPWNTEWRGRFYPGVVPEVWVRLEMVEGA